MAEVSAAEQAEQAGPGGRPEAAGRLEAAEQIVSPGVVERSDDNGVTTLTLRRGSLNALNGVFADQIAAAIDECAADTEVRVVVLTGAGPYFCVGADLTTGATAVRDTIAADGGGAPTYREPAGRATLAIQRLPKPLIVAFNGDAVGGGVTITLPADLRFAAETARFSFPFTRLGVCPEGASTYLLPRIVGLSRATDWLISGRLVDASEALVAGLVHRVVPSGEVLSAAQAYARELADNTSPAAVAATKALLAAEPSGTVEASDEESRVIVGLALAPDCVEGCAAFLEHRAPRFAPPRA